ncbi:MAG: glycosyltransferase, partial [Acidobacteriota bacterium]|nr:glycosyltransferase [Acidobacteriota bacterium]
MVQARWGHANRRYSLLTRLQALLLDGHFVLEHGGRHRGGCFFNFNGTAGIWRRAAIESAGGWQHDTLTEDLDLSYRAQLAGWRFVFLPDVVAPAELPVEMSAFKSQQHRWAKGSIQTCRKVLPAVLRADVPLRVKAEAVLHLTANFHYLLVLALCVLIVPALVARTASVGGRRLLLVDAALFGLAALSVVTFYAVSQREIGGRWWARLRDLPAMIALGLGLSVNNALAVVEALSGRTGEFRRTPKYGLRSRGDGVFGGGRRGRLRVQPVVEIVFGAWFTLAIAYALAAGVYGAVPFLALFQVGFFYAGFASRVPRYDAGPGEEGPAGGGGP